MPNVEGLTPSVLWTTIYGLVGLCILVTVVLTAYEKVQSFRDKRHQRAEAGKPSLADQISKKVLAELEPRLKDIENKLDNDKTRIDNHEHMLAGLQGTNASIRAGLHAYGKTMLVLLNHGNFGDSREVKEATDELNKFLAEQV